MAEKRRPDQDHAGQQPGLDHGAASLVATDSPDDPQIGAPADQIERNRPKTADATAEGWRSPGRS